jgi:hypothetical protein
MLDDGRAVLLTVSDLCEEIVGEKDQGLARSNDLARDRLVH